MAGAFLRVFRVLLAAGALVCALGAAAPAQAAAAPTAAVQAHLLWSRYNAADRERLLDRAKEAGAGMVRVDIGWASLEQGGKGNYNAWYLGKMDHVVTEAEKRGIKVLFTFWETPCWASTAPESLKQGCAGTWWNRGVQRYAPANPADFADALAFSVGRYGDRVAAWELWNEPNHPTYFKAADQVSAYAAIVKAAYPVAKAAHPGATIIAGSLADADFEFTRALLDAGVGGYFDAWSVHPYSEDRSPLHPGIPGWTKKSFAAGVPAVRDTLLRRGEDKPIWLTEFGWSTCTVRGARAYENCVDPETQAAWLGLALAHMRTWTYVPVGVAFGLEDTSTDLGDRVENYGLLRVDGSPKPAFAAFRSAAQAIATGAPIPPTSQPLDPQPPVSQPPVGNAPAREGAGEVEGGEASTTQRQSTLGLQTATRHRVTFRAARKAGRVRLTGHLSLGRTVLVRAYRWDPRARRFSRRTSYRALVPVAATGAFSHRIANAALGRGRWLVVVKGRRRPVLSATARVGR